MSDILQSTNMAVPFKGERVSHMHRSFDYYAHLSIYAFAARYCRGKRVLDAGSGAGYGADYLAEHGAENVLGVDVSEEAVRFSEEHFRKPNLEYRQLDLEHLEQLQPQQFDLIYSSNVLEHVPNAAAALHGAAGLLASDGVMVIAVPPIVRQDEWEANVMNAFHLNLWTPRQWLKVVERYFEEVQPFFHTIIGFEQLEKSDHFEEITQIDENDFEFESCDIGDYYQRPSKSVIFIARRPRVGQAMPADAVDRYVEGSFSRPLRVPGSPIYQVSSLREARLRALAIYHEEGLGAMFHRTLGYISKSVRKT